MLLVIVLTVGCQYILLKLFCNSKGGNVLFRIVQNWHIYGLFIVHMHVQNIQILGTKCGQYEETMSLHIR